jgi:hypothetical protein
MKTTRFSSFLSIFLAGASALAAPPAAPYSLNDVSMLLPLPKSQDELSASYLNGTTVLATGPLVSSGHLKLFDWKGAGVGADIDLRDAANVRRLVVLGVRMDPCFQDLFTDACRPQIRLILQEATFGAKPSTADVGIHLFFDTTDAEVRALIQFAADYRTKFLGPGSARAPLQIQPVVSQEGVLGPFWQAFRPRLLKVLGSAAPTRIAFFTMLPSERDWIFRSFNLKDGEAKPIEIPGLNGKIIQPIDNQTKATKIDFISVTADLPRSAASTDQTFDFLRDSVEFRRSGDSRIQPLQVSLERLENPTLHLPGTVDCLSCHSTPAIKTNLRKSGVALGPNAGTFAGKTLPASASLNLYEDTYTARDFRLFGYRDASPIVGQRVIHESAAIVDLLSR